MTQAAKSEFIANFKKQVLKLNAFLQTWGKETKVRMEELQQKSDGGEAEQFDPRRLVIVEFTAAQKSVLDLDTELKDIVAYEGVSNMIHALRSIQDILRRLFFGPNVGETAKQEYLVKLIEELIS